MSRFASSLPREFAAWPYAGFLPSLEPQLTQIRFTLHDFVKTELLDVAIAVSDGP